MVWSEGLLRGKWSGLRSATWNMVWTERLLRGKRAALEVCCEENGMVWRSAARKMVCSSGVPV